MAWHGADDTSGQAQREQRWSLTEFLPEGPFLHTGRQALFAKPVSPAACAEKVVISHPIPLIFEISP